MAVSFLRQAAFGRVAELARSGIGADRIYRTVRAEFGPGYSRTAIRQDALAFRSDEYVRRYLRRQPEQGAQLSRWQERPITSTQKSEFLWEVRWKYTDENKQEHERFATFRSNELLSDDEVLSRALTTSVGIYGMDEHVPEIVSRWHLSR